MHRRVGKIVRERFAATERGSCGKWRVASNLHFMAEGERATEPSREVPPTADRDGGSSQSALVVELPESKSDTSSGMRGRIGVVIGLLLAAILLYFLSFTPKGNK